MRISDTERREVAKRLRQMADAHYAVEASRVARALGLEYEVHGTVVAFNGAAAQALADLIDRPTCRNIYDEDEDGACANGFQCSACEHVVEDYEGYRVHGTWNYCPNCGAEVIDGNR